MILAMKNLLVFILCQMILTTFVFAQHTKINTTRDIYQVLEFANNIRNQKSINSCSPKVKSFVVSQLNTQITLARNSNETLENSVIRYQRKLSFLKFKQTKKVARLLKRNRKLNRLYRKVQASNPELTFNQMVKNLKDSMKIENQNKELKMIETQIYNAGSLATFLEEIKANILDCKLGALWEEGGGYSGLVLLILFIGLPILSIIGVLIAFIMGAFWWALGFFLFAVVMLATLFVWAQFPQEQGKLIARGQVD